VNLKEAQRIAESHEYVCFLKDTGSGPEVVLDGEFTLEELEVVVYVLKEKLKETTP